MPSQQGRHCILSAEVRAASSNLLPPSENPAQVPVVPVPDKCCASSTLPPLCESPARVLVMPVPDRCCASVRALELLIAESPSLLPSQTEGVTLSHEPRALAGWVDDPFMVTRGLRLVRDS